MSVTVYRDAGYQGPFAHIRPGFFSGRDLVGYYNQSAYGSGEDLDNAISSLRVGPNTIAALYGGQGPSASGGARVIVGPSDVPDLAALGMNNKISSVQVMAFKAYDSAIPRSGGATLYGGYDFGGRHAALERGDYDAARLASEEVKLPRDSLRSIRVSPHAIAILYAGPDFNVSGDAVAVVGPAAIADLDSVGLLDRVSSIRVLYTDPYDVPRRLPVSLGAPRTHPPPTPPAPQTTVVPVIHTVTAAPSRRMWAVIFLLIMMVLVLAAFVVSQGKKISSASGGAENDGPPLEYPSAMRGGGVY